MIVNYNWITNPPLCCGIKKGQTMRNGEGFVNYYEGKCQQESTERERKVGHIVNNCKNAYLLIDLLYFLNTNMTL